MRRPTTLPSLPPTPTSPMGVEARKALAEALKSLAKHLTEPQVQRHVQEGYARVWLHLVLTRGMDPQQAVSAKQNAYQAVLPAFQAAGERMGLHNQSAMTWWAPKVAVLACQLWRKAMAVQGSTHQPLPGLEL